MNVRRVVGRDLLLLAVAFVLSLPLVTPRIYASDEVQYFAYLRSLWFDRDLSFENEYQHFYDTGVTGSALFHETFLERRTEATGLRVTFATLGPALLWSPFYAAADAIVAARRAMGATVPRDGFSQPYVAAVAYGSAVYGWLAIVLGWWMARRMVGASHAPAAAAAVWVGTPLFFYMYIAPPMSHACSAFAVAAFLAMWLRVRDRWSPAGCAALGALAALMAMVREQDAFVAIGPAVDWASLMLAGSRRQGCRGSVTRNWPAAIARSGFGGRGVSAGLFAAALGLHGAERLSGPVASRRPEDELAVAARARRAGSRPARPAVLDAARGAGACRSGRARLAGRLPGGADDGVDRAVSAAGIACRRSTSPAASSPGRWPAPSASGAFSA